MNLENFLQEYTSNQSLRNIKQINDQVWYYYSIIGIIPAHLIFLYKVIWPTELQQIIKIHGKKPFPNKIEDYFVKPFCMWAMVYYFIDTICHVLSGTFIKDGCSFGYTMHHVLSLQFLPRIMIYHMTPNQVLVGAFHAWLLLFPEVTWLNYIYLAICLKFHYQLYQKPFSEISNYIFARRVIWCLYVAMMILTYFGCKNTMRMYETM